MTTFVADNSMLGAMAECDLREVVEYGLGYRSKTAKLTLESGNAIHKARALFWKGEAIERCMAAFEAYYKPFCEEYPPPAELERLSLANVRDVLRTVLYRAGVEDYPFIPLAPYVESGIKVPLAEGLELFALIDCPAQDASTGAMCPVDTKSTGNISAWWAKKWRRASQLSGYCYAMEQWQGVSVNRAYVDAIETRKLPYSSSTRCKKHKVPYSECRLDHANSEVLVTMRSPETIKRWKEVAVYLARKCQALNGAITDVEMLQYVKAPGEFNNSCTFCDFADWCGSDRSLLVLTQEYIIDKWEPWEKGGV